jgi:hypothetical protein
MPLKKPKDKTLDSMMNREIEVMEISLTAKARRLSITLNEYIEMQLAMGVNINNIQAELLADLDTGGRIFGEFVNAIKATANGVMYRSRDNAEIAEIGIDTKWRWVAVLVNTCPDCLERHGEVNSWEEWESIGFPRTGTTVCRERCRCSLVPEEASELEPVKREKQ